MASWPGRGSTSSPLPSPSALMRHALCCAAFALSVLLAGCDSVVGPSPDAGQSAARPSSTALAQKLPNRPLPEFHTQTPEYPAVVLYALHREYVNKYKPKKFEKGDRHYMGYVEGRLRKIYPGRGYDGMIEDGYLEALGYLDTAATFGDQSAARLLNGVPENDRAAGRSRHGATFSFSTSPTPSAAAVLAGSESGLIELEPQGPCEGLECFDPYAPPLDPYAPDASWDSTDEEYPLYAEGYVPTVQEEIEYTSATAEEEAEMLHIEQLAVSGGIDKWALTLDDGTGFAANGPQSSQMVQPVGWAAAIGVSAVAVGIVGGYVYWRASQSAGRAYGRAELYYGNLTGDDDNRDAFRHMYVNVLLRRYITGVLGKLIMDHRERNSTPREKAMDLHNNDIGRSVRYEHFRARRWLDRWNWEKWGERVRDYTNSPSNREFIPSWAIDPGPTASEAQARERLVPDAKYITYR